MNAVKDDATVIREATDRVEAEKLRKKQEREERKKKREAAKRRDFREKLVAPVLLILSALVSLLIKFLAG